MTTKPQTNTALATVEPQEPAPIVRAVSSDALRSALVEYRRVQTVLDEALPDCMMTIQGRQFRKKNYWRAVTTAFNLDVTLEHEERLVDDAAGDWGYVVIYRATAPNGRSATGDGACMAGEKKPNQRSLHNVRAHAHTRAYNRAVSNLVGFGEVSAEEIDEERDDRRPAQREPQIARHHAAIAEAWKTAVSQGAEKSSMTDLLGSLGYERVSDVDAGHADAVIRAILDAGNSAEAKARAASPEAK